MGALTTALLAGAGIVGAGTAAASASGARKAAKQYANAADQQAAQIRQTYDDATRYLTPNIATGQAANTALARLTGLDTASTPIMQEAANATDWDAWAKMQPDLVQAYQQLTPKDFQFLQSKGYGNSLGDYARAQYEGGGEFAQAVQAGSRPDPRTVTVGQKQAQTPAANDNPGGTTQPQSAEDYLKSIPGVAASLKAGTDAVTQSAYGTGRSGGGVLQAINDNAEKYLYDVYNNEANRFQGIAGQGQNAATSLANIGTGAATGAANAALSGEQARASAYTTPLSAALGSAAGFLGSQAGGDILGDLDSWWKNRNGGSMKPPKTASPSVNWGLY